MISYLPVYYEWVIGAPRKLISSAIVNCEVRVGGGGMGVMRDGEDLVTELFELAPLV